MALAGLDPMILSKLTTVLLHSAWELRETCDILFWVKLKTTGHLSPTLLSFTTCRALGLILGTHLSPINLQGRDYCPFYKWSSTGKDHLPKINQEMWSDLTLRAGLQSQALSVLTLLYDAQGCVWSFRKTPARVCLIVLPIFIYLWTLWNCLITRKRKTLMKRKTLVRYYIWFWIFF